MVKKVEPNHDLFISWNESSAYILGFWMADGCIMVRSNGNGRYYKVFRLDNTDLQIMKSISEIMRHNLMTIKPRKKHWKKSYAIYIYSSILFDFCYNITNSTAKSDKYIKIPNIPKQFQHHFIRGLFDGDGSIGIKSYKTRHGGLINALQSSFTAGKDTGKFLEDVRDMIRDHVPVGFKKICGKASKKLAFNQYDTMLLCDWMYKDATMYMKRKKDIFDSFDKNRLLRSQKFFSNKV